VHRGDATAQTILTLNAGSSTLKCGLFTSEPGPQEIARRLFEGGAAECMPAVEQWIRTEAKHDDVAVVGHRIVHGGPLYREPQRITPEVVSNLRSLVPFAPNHLPQEVALIDTAMRVYPEAAQIACFDTAFHATMPEIARRLPLPGAFAARGVQKYGFHGLSFAYLMEELRRVAGPVMADGRIVLAHLGNGSSLAAVHRGRSMDTTMGLTPIGGVVMGTRTGDLDPGVVTHLARTESLSADALEDLLSRQSGLLGISGATSDMKTLLERERTNAACALAVDIYVYSIAKAAGALAAALGGIDAIVFSGGIGEHAPSIRQRVLQRLAWLGIDVDPAANDANAPVISSTVSRIPVRVIRTDEELMIARAAFRLARTQETHVDRS
jgi:acetate kinase